VPFVYFGSALWGAEGVLIGQMAGGVFVAVISFVLAQRIMKLAEKGQVHDLKEEPYIERQRVFNLFHSRR